MSVPRLTRTVLPAVRHAHTSAQAAPVASSSRSTLSASPTSVSSGATHHLITLVRSPRGLPPQSRQTLEALGLHRLHQSVLQSFSGPTAGKILKVKELVTVRNVGEEEGRRLMTRRRPEGGGFEVSGRAYGGGKSVGEVSGQ